uniref:Coiled-coil domain-containing protein 124 n=1 Tax=Plectus sambesii TaxID=2011161 RepID=A0A914VBJ0_9BILA
MPKKFAGENSKATVAKARKAAVEAEKSEQKKKAEEDAYWEDDDKSAAKKQQRKEEQEKKRLEALQRKQASKAALEEEMNSIGNASSAPRSVQPTKVTRAQLDAQKEYAAAQRLKEQQQKELEAKKIAVQADGKLEENVNRIVIEGDIARTVDEAISVLGDKQSEVDRHPEKRMKAAYLAFEEVNLPRLKQENPTQRLSQLKQMLKKEWLKSPENPVNQRLLELQNRDSDDD